MGLKKYFRYWLRVFVCVCLLAGWGGQSAWCADAESFKTSEYNASTGLTLINAANAYALGYTGRGITLGVCDDYVQFYHSEFAGKSYLVYVGGPSQGYNWTESNHGTHVAGIMAAAKNNAGMHGLAFDADLLSGNFKETGSAYDGFNRNASVRVINNSWGVGLYIDSIGEGKNSFLTLFNNESNDYAILRQSILNYDKVLVFSAANSGHTTPGALSLLPYMYRDTAGNFINVIALNSGAFTANAASAGTNAMAVFSDLSKYVEENSVSAPGWSINSANAANGGYVLMSGTSMAAPYVTATAGLVQQAFPYMTGRQIVDTVLSTANSSFTLPKFTLTLQEDYADPKVINQATKAVTKTNLFYFGAKPATAAEIEDDLRAYYSANSAHLVSMYGFATVDQFLAVTLNVYGNTPREMVFGQGLLDAGKAVRGPALLNARRLEASSFSPATAYGINQALYKINTQGYDSVWSNNIGERRVGLLAAGSAYEDLRNIYAYYIQGDTINGFTQGQDYINEYNAKATASGLNDLPVGLYKEGAGTLALTGANTYQGSSVAAGGVLQIDGLVAGDAYSVADGTIAGAGTITGNLHNLSAVRAGSYGAPGTLRVGGNLVSSGKFAVAVANNVAGKIAVTGTANVEGSGFKAVSGSVYRPDGVYTVLTAGGGISGSFVSSAFTGMLSASGSHDGATASMSLTRENNVVSPSQRQQGTYSQMSAMYDALAGTAAQRQMDALFSLDAAAAGTTLAEIYGGAQLNQAAMIQRSTMMGGALSARLSQAKQSYNVAVEIPIPGFTESDLTVKTVIPLQLDAQNSWWMKLSRNGGTLNAYAEIPEMKSQSFGMTVGRDWKSAPHWRTGWLFAYEKSDVTSSTARSKIYDYRVGVYGGYSKDAFDLQTFFAYGQQNNAATRYLQHLGLTADSRYNSNTLSLGIEAKYNLQHGKDTAWQLSPYSGLEVTRYSQNSYGESGAGVYNQEADALTNTYSAGEIGLELKRSLAKGYYTFNVGYKKIFGGYNPEMTVAYSGNPGEKLKIGGSRQDREFLTWGLEAEGRMGPVWTISGRVGGEMGSHSRYWNASVMVRRVW
ncbi:S8 family serine peptidase [Anaeroselena agilis]|uniref:S8 family serine peptidase n=1 Tax=Anaeroselena agilis TaxID=3063788 RepID=A0ABU3P2H8_9FIRM|nr:S8 family serine peptidase [Selenomonadales bacterium 4137-cl]